MCLYLGMSPLYIVSELAINLLIVEGGQPSHHFIHVIRQIWASLLPDLIWQPTHDRGQTTRDARDCIGVASDGYGVADSALVALSFKDACNRRIIAAIDT